VLYVRFDAASPGAAEALCKRVVAAYLQRAPRLPVIMKPAARLVLLPLRGASALGGCR
jgi:hypothetical protein